MQIQNIRRISLILFVSFELSYYLLIAQTGIVEFNSSNIFTILPLPIGGIIGSFLAYFLKLNNTNKIYIFLTIQLFISFFYPNLTNILLFTLGISVGALAPLIINELKKASAIDLGLSLAISYLIGTFLFNYDVTQRKDLAILLTLISLISSFFLPKNIIKYKSIARYENHSLLIMFLWVILDSSLFETLSRDLSISIWRDGFTMQIALFHCIGVIAALMYKFNQKQKELFIFILFFISYLFYFLEEALVLSIVYPFVISYYNIAILQTILRKDLFTISIYMIFIGWIASGLGLFIAINKLIIF